MKARCDCGVCKQCKRNACMRELRKAKRDQKASNTERFYGGEDGGPVSYLQSSLNGNLFSFALKFHPRHF